MKELEKSELMEVDGGVLPWVIAVGIAAIVQVISDWDNFERGFLGKPYKEKWNEMKELKFEELKNVEGGASFAYRIGQLLRGVFMSAGNPEGYCNFIMDCLINEEAANKK